MTKTMTIKTLNRTSAHCPVLTLNTRVADKHTPLNSQLAITLPRKDQLHDPEEPTVTPAQKSNLTITEVLLRELRAKLLLCDPTINTETNSTARGRRNTDRSPTDRSHPSKRLPTVTELRVPINSAHARDIGLGGKIENPKTSVSLKESTTPNVGEKLPQLHTQADTRELVRVNDTINNDNFPDNFLLVNERLRLTHRCI
jgi:hypothetical protein